MKNFILDLAILGTYAKTGSLSGNPWFRQREIRFVAEMLINWSRGPTADNTPLHNTQILRRLEALEETKFLLKREGPEYQLTPEGCLHLLQGVRSYGIVTEDLQDFLLLHYFVSSNKDKLQKLFARDGLSHNEMLDLSKILAERREHLLALESYWMNQIEKVESNLTDRQRIKKLWNPSLEWIHYQKGLLESL